jgi:DNA-directed RNA polymerase specialized sigma24 family protein
MNNNEFIPTRRSLLSRLKRCEDQQGWKEFFETYSKLIHRMALKAGLMDAEAQDVVQETMIVVARKAAWLQIRPGAGFVQELVAAHRTAANREAVEETDAD